MNGIKESLKTQKSVQNATRPTGIENAERKKKCSKCGDEKLLSYFYKCKSTKDFLRTYCKLCCSVYGKISYAKNSKKVSKYGKRYRADNREKISKQKAKRYIDVIKPNYDNIKEALKPIRNKRYKERFENDINFRLVKNIRNRIQETIKIKYKGPKIKAIELMGCTAECARNHLESQFTDGMSWDNYGSFGWHIDHRRPVSSFDLSKKEDLKECFHYTNLQPLWAEDNYKKGSKYDG